MKVIRLAFPAILSLCCYLSFVAAQTPQQQQRPRRVGETQNGTSIDKKPEEVDENDIVRVDTQLVSVPTFVTNPAGRPISGLAKQNFTVFEDGQKQTITNFGTTEAPFEVALLLDTSG